MHCLYFFFSEFQRCNVNYYFVIFLSCMPYQAQTLNEKDTSCIITKGTPGFIRVNISQRWYHGWHHRIVFLNFRLLDCQKMQSLGFIYELYSPINSLRIHLYRVFPSGGKGSGGLGGLGGSPHYPKNWFAPLPQCPPLCCPQIFVISMQFFDYFTQNVPPQDNPWWKTLLYHIVSYFKLHQIEVSCCFNHSGHSQLHACLLDLKCQANYIFSNTES